MKISTGNLTYSTSTKTFYGSEKDIRFDTEYEVTSSETGNSRTFKFKRSTGPEFDPNTKWIYESECGLSLIISNDKEITERNAANYLAAKLRH